MAEKRIDVPGDGRRFIDTEEAAAWLRVSEHTFERMVKREGWIRRIKGAKESLWDPLDVFILGHLMERRGESSPGEPDEPPAKKS